MVIAAALASGINYYNRYVNDPSSVTYESKQFTDDQQTHAIKKIKSAQNNINAQFWVGFNGKIVQKLKDDTKGIQHQKFLIKPISDITLLVAHNIDLAPREPINTGDMISIYGKYEWNSRGGVIHWTHHDPKEKLKGGWINANSKIYR